MTTVHNSSEHSVEILKRVGLDQSALIAFTKGAVDGLLKISSQVKTNDGVEPLNEQWINRIRKAHDELASQGIRVLGLAYKELNNSVDVNNPDEVETNVVFSGMIGLIDPAKSFGEGSC